MWTFIKTKPISAWEIAGYVVLAGIGIGVWMWMRPTSVAPAMQTTAAAPEYATIFPQISPSFAEQKFVGRVVSNSFAMIHPRREGVVRDVLVDVGDTVTAGQTVAVLFPPGVEGQSSTQISRALAELQSAQDALRSAESVATESVALAQKNLDVLQDSGDAERSKLAQQYDNARTTATQELQNLRRIFFGTTTQTATTSAILGTFNDSVGKQQVYNLFVDLEQRFAEDPDDEDLVALLPKMNELLDASEILYRSASETSTQTAAVIEQRIRTIQAGQSKMLMAQERLDNALLALQTAGQNVDLVSSTADAAVTSARTRLEIARAAYQSVLTSSGNVQVTSPFSGTITSRMVEVGHMASPAMAMFEIVGADTALGQLAATEVQFGVPQEFLNQLTVGDLVQVFQPDRGTSTPATVTRVSPALDSRTQTATVHAKLDSPIAHNTRVLVMATQSDAPVLSVPSTAIKRRGIENFVWVVADDQPKFLPVVVLAEDGEFSDVVSPALTTELPVIAEPSVRLWRTSTPFLTSEKND